MDRKVQGARTISALALLLGVACAGETPAAALGGVDWVLVELSGEPVPQGEPEATLAYDPAERRVAGSAGCNRYFGGLVKGPDGGAFELGPVGATRRLCPAPQMALEDRFLPALGEVRRWERSGDRLRLVGQAVSLVFAAREAR